MYPEDIEAWLRTTQKAKWDRLVALNGDKAQNVVMDGLEAALERNGTIQVLR